MSKRKQGETKMLIEETIDELTKDKNEFTVKEIYQTYGAINSSQLSDILKKLPHIERVSKGIYRLKNRPIVEAPETKSAVEKLTETIASLPDAISSLVELMVDVCIEPELEIMNLIERRNRRITDMEVLLSKTRLEASNARHKIEELLSKINKLAAQKNRVIPETKIIVRNS